MKYVTIFIYLGPFQSHCIYLLLHHNGMLLSKIYIRIGGGGWYREGGREAEVWRNLIRQQRLQKVEIFILDCKIRRTEQEAQR
jgi:hypothetical protein